MGFIRVKTSGKLTKCYFPKAIFKSYELVLLILVALLVCDHFGIHTDCIRMRCMDLVLQNRFASSHTNVSCSPWSSFSLAVALTCTRIAYESHLPIRDASANLKNSIWGLALRCGVYKGENKRKVNQKLFSKSYFQVIRIGPARPGRPSRLRPL